MVPEVVSCQANHCFYNRDNQCYAHAILVGSSEPTCETFADTGAHTGKHGEGDVGACHISTCQYNEGMFCHACSDIQVGLSEGKVMCLTYESR